MIGRALACALTLAAASARADPLPSWQDGPTKARIVAFVEGAADPTSARFVPFDDRIATFDQDGTLWTEHPLYAQAAFALDQVKRMAAGHPEWQTTEPWKTVLSGDREALSRLGQQDLVKILAATHTGMSTDEFHALATAWIRTARDPRWKKPYTELVYAPMLEVVKYLQANGFKVYIVTGGDQAFVRAFSQEVYGIPPQNVIGSSVATRFEMRDGKPVLMREPKPLLVDDKGGKPSGIELFIGKRPVIAFGNSDGDREMLEWTTVGQEGGLGALVLHSDGGREYAYGPAAGLPDTKVGAFSQAVLDEAKQRSWIVIDMKRDWRRVFRFESMAGRPAKTR